MSRHHAAIGHSTACRYCLRPVRWYQRQGWSGPMRWHAACRHEPAETLRDFLLASLAGLLMVAAVLAYFVWVGTR